mgnify:CR=1 FL=1
MKKADIIISLLFIVIAGGFLASSVKLGYMVEATPGAGFFPIWISLILAVSAIILLVQSIVRKDGGERWLPDREGLLRIAYLGGATISAVALTKFLGMLLALGLYMGFLVLVLERHRWYTVLGAAVLTPVFIYLVFQKWLMVPLPTGFLGI